MHNREMFQKIAHERIKADKTMKLAGFDHELIKDSMLEITKKATEYSRLIKNVSRKMVGMRSRG